jgi:hypothetical protein
MFTLFSKILHSLKVELTVSPHWINLLHVLIHAALNQGNLRILLSVYLFYVENSLSPPSETLK